MLVRDFLAVDVEDAGPGVGGWAWAEERRKD